MRAKCVKGEKIAFWNIYIPLLRSKQNAKFFDFLKESRLIFVVLSGRFQDLKRDFGVKL